VKEEKFSVSILCISIKPQYLMIAHAFLSSSLSAGGKSSRSNDYVNFPYQSKCVWQALAFELGIDMTCVVEECRKKTAPIF